LTDAAVIVPALSRVRLNVIVAFPRAFWSALVIGGTSFDAANAAVNVMVLGCVFDGDDGLLPQAAARMATAAITYRFIVVVPLKDVFIGLVLCVSVFVCGLC
jgi:hypothetical protein